jgi:hypothetical protein
LKNKSEKIVTAGREARKILAKKNIIKNDSESIIDEILKNPEAPILPGGSSSKSGRVYLPSPWTINTSRRIVYDIARLWELEVKKSKTKNLEGSGFFVFAIKELNRVESSLEKAIRKKVKKEEYDFVLLNRRETINAIKIFLVDSFAISVIAKAHDDAISYLKWFDHWSVELLKLWPRSVSSVDAKLTKKDGGKEE